jgi:hypothetical protein
MTTQEKLQAQINYYADVVERRGSARWDVSPSAGYGWDADEWNYRYDIMAALRERGYSVRSEVNHGVTDIFITKPISLS